MSKEYYKLYIENNIQLAETIVVKSERDADSINEWITKDFGSSFVDEFDKASWKYYKNICGEYHSTDDMIYITSLDTVATIAFTKANLALHPTTRAAYRYDSRYYRELLLENPGKEQLILGVLYPADMTHAVNAPDGTILSYPPHLIEPNEVGLVQCLQTWIDNYLVRWYNLQFNNSHSLYNDAHKAVMFLNMLPEILNLRLRACHTDEVHSFHIREFLASHNGLDKYLEFFNRKQALWLYRNIRVIERRAGMRDTFDWLVENILTERGIPLSRFTMRHDVSKLPNEVYPEISFVKSPVNTVYSQDDAETANYSLDRVLEKETPLAPYNAQFITDQRSVMLEKFIDSRSNVVQTKMLESSLIDYTDATPYTLQEIAFSHWGYLAQKNLYTAYIRFSSPRNGTEYLLRADEAFIYYMFLFAKACGVSYPVIPKYRGWRVASLPPSTTSYLMEVVNTNEMEVSKAQDLVNSMPTITTMNAIPQFTAKMRQLYDAAQYQLGVASLEQLHGRRAYVQNMCNRLYQDAVIDFGDDIDTEQWVAERGLPNETLSELDCFEMYQVIFEAATGLSIRTTEQMAALQRAMLAVMTDLSSYSIQFLATINASAVTPIHWAVIRPDDIKVVLEDILDVELPDTTVVDSVTSTLDVLDIEIEPIVVTTEGVVTSVNESLIELPVKVIDSNDESLQEIDINIYNFSIDSPHFDAPRVGPVRYFDSYQEFYDLTEEERQSIRSVHNCFVRPVANTHIDLADSLLRDTLASFHYVTFEQPVINSFKFIYMPSIITSGIKSIISATLDGVVMTGGRWEMPGIILLGSENPLSVFIKTNDTVKVDGFKYNGPGLSLPLYALEDIYGIGPTMAPLVLMTEHRTFEFNNTFQHVISTVRYNVRDTAVLTLNPSYDHTSLTLNSGISENFVSPMKFNSERVTLGLTYVKDYTQLNLSYVPADTMTFNGMQFITENLVREKTYITPDPMRFTNGSPFFGDRESIGKPHYRLGSFVIDSGTGKVDFQP